MAHVAHPSLNRIARVDVQCEEALSAGTLSRRERSYSSTPSGPFIGVRRARVRPRTDVYPLPYGLVEDSEAGLHTSFLLGRIDMIPGAPRLALRRRRGVMIALALSAALVLSALGIESASASTRSSLAVSLNSDRSNAVRLDGATVKGKIYVFVRNLEALNKVDGRQVLWGVGGGVGWWAQLGVGVLRCGHECDLGFDHCGEL
jgi:hypothetical protein